jgi:hypothetical protein
MISRRAVCIGAGLFVLAGCATQPPPTRPTPRITFAHRPRLMFDVAAVDIQQPFVPSGRPPAVEHLMPVSPATVARQWAADRLGASGTGGFIRYTILDASVTETPLGKDQGVSGLLKSQNDLRYDARIQVRIDVQNRAGTGFAEATVERSQTAREDLTLNERDDLLVAFVEALGRDLDARLQAEISPNLDRFRAGAA